MSARTVRIATAAALVVILAVAITVVATPWWKSVASDTYSAYFANANGLYTGDEVRILGVAVGTIEAIDPQPGRTKVTFSVDRQYSVPAEAKAAILSPSLVTARAIQLVPVYSGGPKLAAGATIPQERTAVPVEWDDFRQQLEKLTESLQPTTPGGPSAVGEFVNTAADNLRGTGRHGPRHRDQAFTSGFGTRRPQHRHLHHGTQPCAAGVGPVVQQRPARGVQQEPRRCDHRAVQHA